MPDANRFVADSKVATTSLAVAVLTVCPFWPSATLLPLWLYVLFCPFPGRRKEEPSTYCASASATASLSLSLSLTLSVSL